MKTEQLNKLAHKRRKMRLEGYMCLGDVCSGAYNAIMFRPGQNPVAMSMLT